MSNPDELVVCRSTTGAIAGTFKLPRHSAEALPDIEIVEATGIIAPPLPETPAPSPLRPPVFEGLVP